MCNSVRFFVIVLIVMLGNSGWQATRVNAQPSVKIILVAPDIRNQEVRLGAGIQEIKLAAQADTPQVRFQWALNGSGRFDGNTNGLASIYVVPDKIAGKSEKVLITVTVTDDNGATGKDSVAFTLLAPAPPSTPLRITPTPPPPSTPLRATPPPPMPTATPMPKLQPTPTPLKKPTATPVPTQLPTAPPSGKTLSVKDAGSGLEMVFVNVPGGRYEMGCGAWADNCRDDEKLHPVQVAEFWIGQTEVTRKQWQQVMGGTRAAAKSEANLPVDNISWDDAQAFIKKMAANQSEFELRLPTEAEWEYACRSGGNPENYSGSAAPDAVAWYLNTSGRKPHPVGTKAANGLGIYDMSGNVREWTQDGYSKDYLAPASADKTKVVRGGGWLNAAQYIRCTNREQYFPDTGKAALGFRVVLKKR